MTYRIACLATVAVAALASPQPQTENAARPAFEVASVKPNKIGSTGGEGSRRESVNTSPGSLTMRNVSLNSCIRWAYGVQDFQISGPNWILSERYDIAAKAADPVPDDQLRLMLQTVLSERFGLTLHRQTKELAVYALVVAKNGPKFHESEGEGSSGIRPNGKTSLAAQRTSMAQFVDFLSGTVLRTPVLDMTGLKGRYDFTLDLTPFLDQIGDAKKKTEGEGRVDILGIILSVLPEQLGLKLEARKAPIEILVIDHAEKVPTEN